MTIIKNALICLNHKVGEEIVFSDFVERCPKCGSEHCWPLAKWLERRDARAA